MTQDPRDLGYDQLPDETVVALAQRGEHLAEEFLIDKYKGIVKIKARVYFIRGADREDLIQEGMIGIFKAIRDYDGTKEASFHSFADLCVTRQIITAIRTAARQKHTPLNSYVSLDKPLFREESNRTLLDVLSATGITDPMQLIISREELLIVLEQLNELLTDLEYAALTGYVDGMSYEEIASDLGCHVKSIDNALQRVKRKLQKSTKSAV
jgi:RNA polymerase sporulation-specific sigma factor